MIRGTGKQCQAAVLSITAYWVIGIPLAYLLAFVVDLELSGLWIGFAAASAYLTITYNILIVCINWPKVYEEVR